MIVPLDVRGRIIGALTFVYARVWPTLQPGRDLASAEELASSLRPTAIDNAKLYLFRATGRVGTRGTSPIEREGRNSSRS